MKKFVKYFLFSNIFLVAAMVVKAQPMSESASGTIGAIQQMGEDEITRIQNDAQHRSNITNTITEGIGHMNTALSIFDSAKELYEASNALDNNECVPDFSTDAQSMMPSSCDDKPGCRDCYQSSISRMTTVRRSLARLSCIRMNTKKFTDAAVAFGDNVAGLHAITGLAWQYQRRGIMAAMEKFNKSYDKKYTELIQSLQIALQGINQCEAKFGMQDWYQRFGFIYFEMMKEKYKRTD
ncbi:MAG: hypothetical protein R2796_05840 [Chitinophagaceae bacterium]|nr:hypothetical protein [Chitinophagaceae bacterium]HQV06780.1 hypothetical protein [Chitinophagaceae bacterium]